MTATSTRRGLLQFAALFLSFAVVFAAGYWLIAPPSEPPEPSPDDNGHQQSRLQRPSLVVDLYADGTGGAIATRTTSDGNEIGPGAKLDPSLADDGRSICVVVPDQFAVLDEEQQWEPRDGKFCRVLDEGRVQLQLVRTR